MWKGAVLKPYSRPPSFSGVHSPAPSTVQSSPFSSALGMPNTPESTMRCLSWAPECIMCALEPPRPRLDHRGQKSAIMLSWCQRLEETWPINFQAGAPGTLCSLQILQYAEPAQLSLARGKGVGGAFSVGHQALPQPMGQSHSQLELFQRTYAN